MVRGLDAAAEAVEPIKERLIGIDIIHIGLLGYFHFKPRIGGIYDHAPQALTLQVGCRPHGGAENPAGFSRRPLVIARPGHSHGRIIDWTILFPVTSGRLGIRFHVFQNQTAHQNFNVLGWICLVYVRVGKYISDTVENGALFRARLNHATAGFALVVPPVTDPAFAQHPFSKATEFAVKRVGAGA